MKTELKLKPHSIVNGQNVIELWVGDKFIGTVVGTEDGVKVISKYKIETKVETDELMLDIAEVKILLTR